MIFLAPTHAIEHFPHLKIILYQTLLRMRVQLLSKLSPDLIMMDELHRTGAEQWGPKVDELLSRYPQAKVLGLTATPDRMDGKNVIYRIFEGNTSYELTLIDALRRGIVKSPQYVKCDYALRDRLEGIQEQIDACDDKNKKRELQELFNKLRRFVDEAEGIPELFRENMTRKDGKYIVFCKDKDHMEEMQEKIGEWFGDIDESPEVYSVYSGFGESENQRTIKGFTDSKSEHLKLLYCVDMLNEGLHVEDISGVIMLRPTESKIIYLQQLGRALSSDTSRQTPIIFDLVNNYLNINDLIRRDRIDGPSRENEEDIDEKKGHTDDELDEDLEWEELIKGLKITGKVESFLAELENIEMALGRRSYLINAREIKRWMEERETTKPPAIRSKEEEEKRLGTVLFTIRRYLIKPYIGFETEEEKEEYREAHPEIDEVMGIVAGIDINGRTKNQQELAELIQEDLRKRGKLAEARALEAEYESRLAERGLANGETKNTGEKDE